MKAARAGADLRSCPLSQIVVPIRGPTGCREHQEAALVRPDRRQCATPSCWPQHWAQDRVLAAPSDPPDPSDAVLRASETAGHMVNLDNPAASCAAITEHLAAVGT